MNKIYINGITATGVEISDDQVRNFLTLGVKEKKALVRMWISNWRMPYETWTISSDVIGWDGINGTFEYALPAQDPLPEGWPKEDDFSEISVNSPKK